METITEEAFGPALPNFGGSCQTLGNHNGQTINIKHSAATPLSSPGRTHKLNFNHNLIGNGFRTPLNASKSHLSVGTYPDKAVPAPVASSVEKAKSYMEQWLLDHSIGKGRRSAHQSRTDLASRAPSINQDLNKCDSMVFSIDMEDESQMKKAYLDESKSQASPDSVAVKSTDVPLDGVFVDPSGGPVAESRATPQHLVLLAGDTIAIQPTIDEERSRHSSSSATSWEYEKPEPHQVTVTSLTPLLNDMELCVKVDTSSEPDVSNVWRHSSRIAIQPDSVCI